MSLKDHLNNFSRDLRRVNCSESELCTTFSRKILIARAVLIASNTQKTPEFLRAGAQLTDITLSQAGETLRRKFVLPPARRAPAARLPRAEPAPVAAVYAEPAPAAAVVPRPASRSRWPPTHRRTHPTCWGPPARRGQRLCARRDFGARGLVIGESAKGR